MREWAFLNTLLQASFPLAPALDASSKHERLKPSNITTKNNIDITISTSPAPKLTLTFARIDEGDSATSSEDAALDDFFADEGTAKWRPPISVALIVEPNARIVVHENNIWTAKKVVGGRGEREERLAKALDVAADLDVWVEFVRGQAAMP